MSAGDHPDRSGASQVVYIDASSILTKTAGFLSAYDFSLNPYGGCSFGCTYCYAAFFGRDQTRRDTWGQWVDVKQNAVDLLMRKKPGSLDGKIIYLSSVTDPYQPIERTLQLTRRLLTILGERHRAHVVIQTRSPLVTRDIDVLRTLARVQVNMTVTTDDDTVRRVFEPQCAAIHARLAAITTVAAAGIPSAVTMTPLLPVADAEAFAIQLLATGVEHFVVQDFHVTRGNFVAGTRAAALQLVAARGWDAAAYQRVVATLRARIPALTEGKDGFAPR